MSGLEFRTLSCGSGLGALDCSFFLRNMCTGREQLQLSLVLMFVRLVLQVGLEPPSSLSKTTASALSRQKASCTRMPQTAETRSQVSVSGSGRSFTSKAQIDLGSDL